MLRGFLWYVMTRRAILYVSYFYALDILEARGFYYFCMPSSGYFSRRSALGSGPSTLLSMFQNSSYQEIEFA